MLERLRIWGMPGLLVLADLKIPAAHKAAVVWGRREEKLNRPDAAPCHRMTAEFTDSTFIHKQPKDQSGKMFLKKVLASRFLSALGKVIKQG